ncbi:PTS sugar transporter subunit IIB [Pseudoleptotrichia goodfellowii]|uniref:PTS system lactose/cellobiose-specific transporter subunit IIB n=1 Tax=Pseudoleptotrichia goodfellowii TaxID=157692 RepID=A0A510J8G9_9FUSO|nr:PTS sugar transporter subunit IIB [Pseudoleptotrichia goodfellowii]BBM35356.1 PTS system lactose/cellobiose-specific transporter subunit IIB [Pseudoleptotrichia goodfellowii]
MLRILTVCGNGIGSSLMLAMKIEEICKEEGMDSITVESSDFNGAKSKETDIIVTVKEIAEQFPEDKKVIVTRSYTNKKKIKEDILEELRQYYNN